MKAPWEFLYPCEFLGKKLSPCLPPLPGFQWILFFYPRVFNQTGTGDTVTLLVPELLQCLAVTPALLHPIFRDWKLSENSY